MKMFHLDELLPGESAVIIGIDRAGGMGRRLRELGMIEGTVVECVGKSPFGDPSAFLVRGTVIALRREDSHHVSVIFHPPKGEPTK